MSVARVFTRTLSGVHARPVTVEVHLAGGLPGMSIVGLAETSVKESRDRVRAAIKNANFEFPKGKIVISLAPADLPKAGSRFDLPIAIGVLAVTGQIPVEPLTTHEFIGELGLTGELRSVQGALPTSLGAATVGRDLVVPLDSAAEAALCDKTKVRAARSLTEVAAALRGQHELGVAVPDVTRSSSVPLRDMADVKGQFHAKRAFEIAAAGGHNILLTGPPGTGKSMLATRMPGLLPSMSSYEATETASIASVSSSGFKPEHWGIRPFRSPHHTVSGVALVGGGSPPRPGEISLAHNGVLFLDELPEFPRSVLDVLREPMESGCISISRANWQAEFPADFQVVAAMNPCACGYFGDQEVSCRCTPDQVLRYQSRISGPFLDRIDMVIKVPRIDRSELRKQQSRGERSSLIRERVEKACAIQRQRQATSNAQLSTKAFDRYCALTDADADRLDTISEKLKLSLRSHVRVIRLARTIADLEGAERIGTPHLMEAVSFRSGSG